ELAAAQTGLKQGTPVVAGGLDAACGTLGAGVCKPGQTQEQGGQAGGMSICVDSALAHPQLILSPHLVPGQWLLQGGTVGGGGTLAWFSRELGAAEEQIGRENSLSPFIVMDDEASESPLGSRGLIYLPYMAGERSPIWDAKAQGVFFGLGYDKKRGDLIRSILEGTAFALEHNVRIAREVGAEISEFRAMGGAANSRIWTQIKADITGTEFVVPSADTATTWGAAMVAGVGAGVYKSYEQAVDMTVSIQRRHQPDMDKHDAYEPYYEIYESLYPSLKDAMHKLADLKNK
ncbi:MAG: FGGY-family carbohydrate kinase, partial [Eubacteriales bacterium]|nr:FGGY-family carbohydrate kinase [Eubacteriales bacterium]